MTQTLYSQFFSIFPLNLGIADFIFFSIVFAGILVIILMSNNIGSKIVRVIQAVGGTAMGVDAALNLHDIFKGSQSPQGGDSNTQGTSNDSSNQGSGSNSSNQNSSDNSGNQSSSDSSSNQSSGNSSSNQGSSGNTLMRVLKGTLLKLRFILSVSSPYSIKFSYFPLMLLNLLGKNIPQDMEPLFNFTGSMLILTLAVFFSILRIILYFFSVYYLDKYNIYDRYPKYRKCIKRMEKIRAYSIYTEIIILFVIVFLMLFLCVFMLWVLLQ